MAMGTHAVFSPAFLESLEEEVGLRPPFVDPPSSFLSPPSLRYTLGTTPSTNTTTLPTPEPAQAPPLHYEGRNAQFSFYPIQWNNDMAQPAAPLLRDMDSFTEGTGVGSFDFSLDSASKGGSGECSYPTTQQSVAFSPDDPLHSIETWRNDVMRSTQLTSTEVSPVSGRSTNASRGLMYRRLGKRNRSSTNDSLPMPGTELRIPDTFTPPFPNSEVTDRIRRRHRSDALPLM